MPEAFAALQKSLAKNPNDPDLLYYYGRAAGLLSKQVFDDLEARFPDSARAHQMMAEDYAALRELPSAEREFNEALKLRPQTAGLHLDLGELYARAQQWDKAEEQFRLEAELQPGSALAAYRLGESLLQLGKFHEARQALAHSNELKPDMPETLYQLGKAVSLDGDDAAAQKHWMPSFNSGIRHATRRASAFRPGKYLPQAGKNSRSRTRDGAIPQIAKQTGPIGRLAQIGERRRESS